MISNKSSKRFRIAWLPGDGIGSEVLAAARIVLDKLHFQADYIHGDIGWAFWCKEGDALPRRTISLLSGVDAAMFGAITSKPEINAEAEMAPELHGSGLVYRSPIVRIRQLFDLHTCLRPCKAYPGNPLNFKENIDLIVFRENTEDLYTGVEFGTVPKALVDVLKEHSEPFETFAKLPEDQYALSTKIITRKGSERILRAAFDFACRFGRKKITVIHKANVIRAADGLFLKVAKEVAREYPQIQMDEANVDAMCMWLLKNPFNYDILVAPNLYGDIVSDLCAQMVGGLGFSCSGNIGNRLAVFEPTHGSAPKYSGMNICNPIATILAAKMMLHWLGENAMAEKIENATQAVIAEGKIRTYDMGGQNSTLEMARAIAAKI